MDMLQSFREEAAHAYPNPSEVDAWAEHLLRSTDKIEIDGTYLDYNPISVSFGNGPNTLVNKYVEFHASDERKVFYGYWQPALNQPAPLLINLPGYGGSISQHPQIADLGYNILHISPLGYVTPQSTNAELALPDGNWPVLPNTAAGRSGGYDEWLSDCLLAIRWAVQQPGVLSDRFSFFGTSQGGGGSLLLASILGAERVRCVCADLPFLTDFPGSQLLGAAYSILAPVYDEIPHEKFWNRLGYIDTISHAHRLTMPVMLSSGGMDETCPPETVERLFALLPGTKQYTYLEHQIHTHSRSSMYLFSTWLKMYA